MLSLHLSSHSESINVHNQSLNLPVRLFSTGMRVSRHIVYVKYILRCNDTSGQLDDDIR